MSRARTPHISALGLDVLQGLYAHRLLSTRQVRELYSPDHSMRWSLQVCTHLEAMGLVARVGVEHAPGRETAWYLTPAGDAVSSHGGERRPYKMTPARAAGPLQAHTLATNEVGLAFVAAAREYGDECGPSSWRNETAHRLGGVRGGDALIADAVLEYVAWDGDDASYLVRFVEIDRATKPVWTVVRQLEAYDRLARNGHPYYDLPGVLVVMAGKPEPMARRITALEHLLAASKVLAASDVDIFIATLDALVAHGPHEAIWHCPGDEVLVDVRGQVPVG